MAVYTTELLFAFGFFLSSVSGQCVQPSAYNYGLYGAGCACNDYLASNNAAAALAAADGGGFTVISASPSPPYGVSVVSENEYSGLLAVIGQLPFLGTAYLEGAVPSAGVGAVTYGCGYGDVAIVSEDFAGAAASLRYANDRITPRAFSDLRGCGCGTLF